MRVFFLSPSGRWNEAESEQRIVRHGDPLNLPTRFSLAQCLMLSGREAEAEIEYRQMLEIDSNQPISYLMLAFLYFLRGRLEEALSFCRKGYPLISWSPGSIGLGQYAGLLMLTGDQAAAEELLRPLGDGQSYGAPATLAIFHFHLGDVDKTIDWMEKAIEQRTTHAMTYLRWMAPTLRSSPRWPALLKQVNLPG